MLILWKARRRIPTRRLRDAPSCARWRRCSARCIERGIRIVVERGRPQPGGARRRSCASSHERLGVRARVAHVEGDDLLPRRAELAGARRAASRTSTPGDPLADARRRAGHRQRLPRRLGHRRGARARRRRRHLPARDRRLARASARRRGTSAGRATTGTASPARVVAGHVIECGPAGDRRQLQLLPRGARPRCIRASRSPRCTPTAAFVDHQAPGHGRPRVASAR